MKSGAYTRVGSGFRRNRTWSFRVCSVECLESRHLLSAMGLAAMTAVPDLVLAPNPGGSASPDAQPPGYSPAQVRHAYGFDQVKFGSTPGDGRGQTIAIVDAYNDPKIKSDLATFDSKFKLPAPPSFLVLNQTGRTKLPAANGGWAQEISLDVEWAHAIAPKANILLVESTTSGFNDMLQAINYARNRVGVSAVSMSFTFSDFSSEANYDSYFTTPAGHTGVSFVAASGDSGNLSAWPDASPNVLSVGGTSLTLDASNNRLSETAWSGSSGGPSAYEPVPSYQQGLPGADPNFRSMPDVSYNANPNTGVAIYDSFAFQGFKG